MNIGWNIESAILLVGIFGSFAGSIYIAKNNWKQYIKLYVIASITGELLCYIFLKLDFYSYPYRLFPQISQMPFFLVLTLFPFYVLYGVRYSPSSWKYKIPFYWVLIHIGVLGEVLSQNHTRIIKYERFWDTWDSYTWWWIYLLIFEIIGGIIVSKESRKPISTEHFSYGKLGWFLIHFILIATIFLAGLFLGTKI